MRTILAALVVLSFPAVALATESHHGAPAPAAPAASAAEAAPEAPAAPASMAAPAAPAAGPDTSDAAADGAPGAPGAAGGTSAGGGRASKAKSSRSSSSAASSLPAAVKVGPEECDLCKARSAYLKAGKSQTVGLDNGVVIISTGNVGALDKAATEFDNQMKNAKEGKAKLDEGCIKFVGSVASGKVVIGHGKTPKGHVMTAMTKDENLALELYELMEKVVVPKKGGKK